MSKTDAVCTSREKILDSHARHPKQVLARTYSFSVIPAVGGGYPSLSWLILNSRFRGNDVKANLTDRPNYNDDSLSTIRRPHPSSFPPQRDLCRITLHISRQWMEPFSASSLSDSSSFPRKSHQTKRMMARNLRGITFARKPSTWQPRGEVRKGLRCITY